MILNLNLHFSVEILNYTEVDIWTCKETKLTLDPMFKESFLNLP